MRQRLGSALRTNGNDESYFAGQAMLRPLWVGEFLLGFPL